MGERRTLRPVEVRGLRRREKPGEKICKPSREGGTGDVTFSSRTHRDDCAGRRKRREGILQN